MSLTTTTTTTAIVETMSPFMLPGMASPELQIDSGSRVVRFDKECVLIPESPKQKRSMVVTRAYSLPLWKRRGQSESDIEDSAHPSERTPSPEEARVFIKVPIPTLVHHVISDICGPWNEYIVFLFQIQKTFISFPF
jgi:hypothetical protein